jgi:hypothetical protein
VKKAAFLSLLQVLFLLVFDLNLWLFVFILILVLTNFILFFVEGKNVNNNLARFLSFIFIVLLTSFFTSGLFAIEFNQSLFSLFSKLSGYFYLLYSLDKIDPLKINIFITGFLFLLNEVNFAVRYFFEALSLVPKIRDDKSIEIDKEEYNAGRVIGMLERILILFFVIVNQFAAIGFIIAAKGFTRFKELDKREFAEYVLTGTLFSSLFAIAVALIVKELIK